MTTTDDRVNIEQSASGRLEGRVLQYNVRTFLVSVGLTNFGGLKKSWRKSFILFNPFLSGRGFPFLLSGIFAAVASGVLAQPDTLCFTLKQLEKKWNAVTCTISNLACPNLHSFFIKNLTQSQLKLMDVGLISNPGRTCLTCHQQHKKVTTLRN